MSKRSPEFQKIYEEKRLVSLSSQEGQQGHAYLDSLSKKLLGDRHDFEKDPIDFYIMDADIVNAFFLKKGKADNERHVIGVSRGLLERCANEDQFGSVLGHELTHALLKDVKNGKPQEALSDINGASLVYAAGGDPKEAKKIMQLLISLQEPLPGQNTYDAEINPDFKRVLSVHPLAGNREFSIDAILTDIQREHADVVKRKPTDFPEDVKEVFTKANHSSYFASQMESYDSMNLDEKFDFLIQEIPNITNKARAAEFESMMLATLQENEQSIATEGLEKASERNGKLAKAFLSSPNAKSDYLRSVTWRFSSQNLEHGGYGYKYQKLSIDDNDVEAIANIRSLLNEFINADSFDVASDRASRLKEAVEQMPQPICRAGILQCFDFPNFSLESEVEAVGKEVPWNMHIEWSNQDPTGNINEILAHYLGVQDYRINYEREINRVYNIGSYVFPVSYPETKNEEMYFCDIDVQTGVINQITPDYKAWEKDFQVRSKEVANYKLEKFIERERTRFQTLTQHPLGEYREGSFEELMSVLNELSEIKRFYTSYEKYGETAFLQKIPEELNIIDADIINEKNRQALTEYSLDDNRAIIDKYFEVVKHILQNEKDPRKLEQLKAEKFLSLGVMGLVPMMQSNKDEYQAVTDSVLKYAVPVLQDEMDILFILKGRKIFDKDFEGMQEHIKEGGVAQDYEHLNIDTIRSVLKYSAPKTPDDIEKLKKTFEKKKQYLADKKEDFLEKYEHDGYAYTDFSNIETLLKAVLQYETFLYITNPENTEISLETLYDIFEGNKSIYSYYSIFTFINMGMIDELGRFIDNEANWEGCELEKRIDVYNNLREIYFIKNGENLERVTGFVDEIDKLPNKIELYEKLFTKEGRINDPELRERVVNSWVDEVSKKLGQDDGTPDYTERVNAYASRIKEIAPVNDQALILNRLSNRVVSQEATAEILQPDRTVEKEEFEESSLSFLVIEITMLLADENPDLARDFCLYLSKEEKIQDSMKLYDKFKERAEKSDIPKVRTSKQFISPVTLQNIHRNFQSSPLEAQAFILNRLFGSSGKENGKSGWREGIELVSERVIKNAGKDRKLYRHILESYTEARGDFERGFLLAAIIASSGKSSEQGISVGKAFKMISEVLDPLILKLCQAVNSDPNTDPEIKRDTADAKGKAAPLPRHKIFGLMKRELPDEVYDDIAHVGDASSGGAYNVTIYTTLQNGEKEVFSIVRPNAEKKADYGAEVISEVAEILPKKGDERRYEKLSDKIRQFVTQAGKMVKVETRPAEYGIKQAVYARELYDGWQGTVDGHEFNLRTVDWNRYGARWKGMEEAEGLTFGELPEGTDDEKSYKKALAKFYTIIEFADILSGKRIDYDPHKEQIKANGSDLRRFDTGGIGMDTELKEVVPPSKEEKRMLGQILKTAFTSATMDIEIADSIEKGITEIAEKGIDVTYLTEVKRNLLAMNDFTSHLTPKEIAETIKVAQRIVPVDKDIITGLELGMLKSFGLKIIPNLNRKIQITRKELEPPPPAKDYSYIVAEPVEFKTVLDHIEIIEKGTGEQKGANDNTEVDLLLPHVIAYVSGMNSNISQQHHGR